MPKMSSACWNTTRPTSVSVCTRPFFANSGSPMAVSSARTWALTVGCDRCSSSAAFDTLPLRTTVQKYSRW